MAVLTVSEFSCLRDATFELAPVNVIIGPQGSGKSITTKLFYFFSDIPNTFLQSAERGDSLEDYKRFVARQFNLWFPATAWGKGRFTISYTAESFSVRVLRRKTKHRLSDEVSVSFSEWFVELYKQALEQFERFQPKDPVSSKGKHQTADPLEGILRAREIISRRFSNEMNDAVRRQTFIPAGRAFFTSIGRLVAGFQQAGSLDPITIKFARLFADIRDLNARSVRYRLSKIDGNFKDKRSSFMNKLFGGEIKYDRDIEFVEASDGRKIPFSCLSSGQQELLPMWSLLDYLTVMDAYRFEKKSNISTLRHSRELVYIEEPEAHLFPSAQSLLMEFLIGSVASVQNRRSLIITTHSPYIMAKLNIFLKAGQLARRKKRNQDINEIVPRNCWLSKNQLAAFAIEDGTLRNLIDDDGLIDGRYLDEVSEEMSREFSRLLKIESEI